MSVVGEQIWALNRERVIHLGRPFLIGILNITPDSFSDGGVYNTPSLAVDRARRMIDEGVDALDIGGESTRPGAARVCAEEQIARVVPVVRAIRASGLGLAITIDTTLGSVARAALDAGCDAINDVSAGSEDETMLALAAERCCGLILMHRERPPEGDSYSDGYVRPPVEGRITARVIDGLRAARDRAMRVGVASGCIMLDPGLGFGKDVDQNLELITTTDQLLGLGSPVLSALSRKSFVGRISLDRDSSPDERLAGTLACSVLHLWQGARAFRVHDVAVHRESLDAAWRVLQARNSGASDRINSPPAPTIAPPPLEY